MRAKAVPAMAMGLKLSPRLSMLRGVLTPGVAMFNDRRRARPL